MLQIEVESIVTRSWLHHNGIDHWIPELIRLKIIEDDEKGKYHILNKEVLGNITSRKYACLNPNDEISRLEFRIAISPHLEEGLKARGVACKEDANLNCEKARELYKNATFNFRKYIALREIVLKDPTFTGHFELGKTYFKLNNIVLAKKEFEIAKKIAEKEQNLRNLSKVKFQLAEIYFNEENYKSALLLYRGLLNNKDSFRIRIRECQDILYKIELCKSSIPSYMIEKDNEPCNGSIPSSMVEENNQACIFITNHTTDDNTQILELEFEKDKAHIYELLSIAKKFYTSKDISLADYVFKQAKDIAKKYEEKEYNIQIAQLQQQRKIYKILR